MFNLGLERATRLDEIANIIVSVASKPVEIEFGSGTDAFRTPFEVKTNRLEAIGWRPRGDFVSEAKRCVTFFS